MTPHFGRVPSPPDARDQLYLMDPPHSVRPMPARRTWFFPRAALDQQDAPHCVAFAWAAMMLSAPIMSHSFFAGTKLPAWITTMYQRSRVIERMVTQGDGSTVRGGVKALHEQGLLSGYLWGYSADVIARYITARGPVVLGTDWYAGMTAPGDDGVMRLTGRHQGGHAYLGIGYDPARGIRILNSWGPDWGQRGRAWLPLDALNTLLTNGGEACSAIELPRPTKLRKLPG
jgi:hypothetical protein